MRILVIGGSGTIGGPVADELSRRHEVVRAGRSSGEATVDISDPASIRTLYDSIGDLDAVVGCAGSAHFARLEELDQEKAMIGIHSKLMGQVNLVLMGLERLRDGGSFTLTTGILSGDPVRGGSMLSLVNGAVNSFATAASIELPRGLRINVVSPGLVKPSALKYGEKFPGHMPVDMEPVVQAYLKSVEGGISGRVLEVH